MSKFNTSSARPSGMSPVATVSATPDTTTLEGGPGFSRDAKSELYLLAVTNFVSEKTFYESAGSRDARYESLIRTVAIDDPEWLFGFLKWLRGPDANMRSASLVGAAEMVKARLDAGETVHDRDAEGWNRRAINAVLQRADEPGEFLAYWTSHYGRNLPMPVKRGVADACVRLYSEYSLLKYDTDSHGWRFADVLALCHAKPATDHQSELFRYAIDRRYGKHDGNYASLTMTYSREWLLALPQERRRDQNVLKAETLAQAGMTWESLAGWLQGPMDAQAWEAIIPSMGYMALLRNLRNFDEAGISSEVATRVATKIGDPEQVAKSRQLPLRFLSAYRAAPSLRWSWPLECALEYSLANIPTLPGRTLILVDTSGSMRNRLSARSELLRWDAAALFGLALARRCQDSTVVSYSSTIKLWHSIKAESLLASLKHWSDTGYNLDEGTHTRTAVNMTYNGHDRVVVLTDEQTGWLGSPVDPAAALSGVPKHVPTYTWNLAGYRAAHARSGARNRHAFGGLTDTGLKIIPLLERGQNAPWPWGVK